ncbi:Polysaccharide biosynthesis protein CpsM(V) [Streptococcus infantarius subsp. infantarius]|nr:Polysaccharide biosynthesis protein CpsM(V) [Streptococcus infantarius subsp. infantarius]
MIPKKIHYCWFGGNPLPDSVKNCINSWKKFCPNYEIIEWNESNYNVHKIPYISEAYKNKKYAFVSDYARLDIIYNEGGFYLDTDVELLKALDDLTSEHCYMGMEQVGRVNTGLGFGAEKGHPFIKENMQQYEDSSFNCKLLETCVDITTNLLLSKGLLVENSYQRIGDVSVYPTDFFCPFNMQTQEIGITKNTYSIHHYDATWYGTGINAKMKKIFLPIKIKIRIFIDMVLGEGTYEKLKQYFKK